MKRMTIPAILVAAVLAFALAGCSGAQNMTEDTLKGVWKLDTQSNVGFDAYASFEDESAFEMILADSYIDGTWSVSGTSGQVSTSDERKVNLTYSNNKLTMGGADGSKLVFVKDDSQEAKEMFALGEGAVDGATADGDGNVEMEEVEYVDEVVNPIDPVAIADDDKATITVTGKGSDFTGDPCFWATFTNKTGKAVYFAAEDVFKVGDKEIDPGLGEELEAGQSVETSIYFPKDELGGGVEALTTTDGVIVMYDNETDEELARYTFHMN